MVNLIEAVGKYSLNLAERTVGISGWREATEINKQNPKEIAPWMGNIFNAAADIVIPTTTRLVRSVNKNHKQWEKHPLSSALLPVAIFTDLALCVPTIAFGHNNPLEIMVWKLTANAASQVALDLGGAAIRRITHIRPHKLLEAPSYSLFLSLSFPRMRESN